MTAKRSPTSRLTSLLTLLGCVSLLVCVSLVGCGDDDDPARGGGSGRAGLDPDAVLVPLSGSHPAHVVGASSFNRFHLQTTGDGFKGGAEEDDAQGVDPAAAAAVRARDAEARTFLGKRKFRSAARTFLVAAAGAQKAGWSLRAERCLLRALRCFELLGEPVEMLEALRRIVSLQRGRKDGLAVARTESDLGSVYGMLANFDRALDHLDAAAEAFGRYGMKRSRADAMAAMGLVYQRRAEYGAALDVLEGARALLEATRDKPRRARLLNVMGNVYEDLGDPDRAVALYEQALALHGKAEGVDKADVLGNLGSVNFHLGRNDDALHFYEQARRIFESHKDHKGTADALFSMGRVKKVQGGYRTALDIYRDALRLQETGSEPAARTLCAIAETYLAMGRPDDALDEVRTAIDSIGGGAARTVLVELLVVNALVHLRKKEPQRAIEKIRRALDLLMEVTAGLADEHVVGVREHRGWVFDAGIAVALKTGQAELAAEFMEHARAGALLAAFGARGARGGLSRELVEARTLAAHRVAQANRAYQEARAERRLQDLRAADAERKRAQAAYRTLMQRIQREDKRGTGVFHPVPDSLTDVRARLEPGDVMVLYTLLAFQAHALVVTPKSARIVWLGNTPAIQEACETLRVDTTEPERGSVAAVEARLALLRRLVIDPLDLPDGTRRLLLSPDGPLCYVPFPLLFEREPMEVACLPSGTTLRLLMDERERTGENVLALGDPVYEIEHQGRSLQVYAEGVPLEPLPATRREVMAITGPKDMRLLGSYASVRSLLDVAATRPRWSVIHLACHGLIDPRTPALSSLALTPEAGDDGFLTALEVYGMALPSDLVVLSGCNTGRGRFMKGEGLVGLMRAFMCAGAPRVVVSLWKVDDEATQALMTRFHALWRRDGLPTSQALRRAQAEIRAVPRWRHPRYWGAWVLWGLVD